jgi:hypothetical protein
LSGATEFKAIVYTPNAGPYKFFAVGFADAGATGGIWSSLDGITWGNRNKGGVKLDLPLLKMW